MIALLITLTVAVAAWFAWPTLRDSRPVKGRGWGTRWDRGIDKRHGWRNR